MKILMLEIVCNFFNGFNVFKHREMFWYCEVDHVEK